MKLLNERPMSELVCDGRYVAFRTSVDRVHFSPAFEVAKNNRSNVGWAELLAPEPKPDANGWWNWDEVKPDFSRNWLEHYIGYDDKAAVVAHSPEVAYNGYDATAGGEFKVKWKYFDLPIE